MAIRSNAAKMRVLAELRRIRAKGEKLELELIIQGEAAEAAKVKQTTRRLVRRIDDLLAAMLREWAGQAATVQDEMRRLNARLQGRIRDIGKKIEVAEKVVEAIGMIDDAAQLAAGLAERVT